jgi:hypothetical protein
VLTFDPVNSWACSLLFVIAVDLAGVHALKARSYLRMPRAATRPRTRSRSAWRRRSASRNG